MKTKISQPKLIDAHTHLNFAAFDEDRDFVVRRTLAEGVWCVNVGTQAATARRAIEMAHQYEGMFAAVGQHPIHVDKILHDPDEVDEKTAASHFDYEELKKIAADPKVVAIGECGLDYFHSKDAAEHKKQEEVFRQHVALARELKKPLMIHCRDAYDDLLKILKEQKAEEVGGDIHFFAGNWEIAQKFLDLGFHLSFTGVITFARDYDEVVRRMPLERLMIETDAPYVAPAPYRGKRNEPLFVSEVAKKVAELRGLTYNEVAAATVANARKLFDI